jgi:hypothetical protein
MSVWFDDCGRYFGIATLGFGNLAGGAQWRFASFGGGVLRRDARFVDDGVRWRGIKNAWTHQTLRVFEAEVAEARVP